LVLDTVKKRNITRNQHNRKIERLLAVSLWVSSIGHWVRLNILQKPNGKNTLHGKNPANMTGML
jgi:hypothetical protein